MCNLYNWQNYIEKNYYLHVFHCKCDFISLFKKRLFLLHFLELTKLGMNLFIS
jgi:hypothetical protein